MGKVKVVWQKKVTRGGSLWGYPWLRPTFLAHYSVNSCLRLPPPLIEWLPCLPHRDGLKLA